MYIRLPADLMSWLKGRAALNRRSMTGEISMILEDQRKQDQRPPQLVPQSVLMSAGGHALQPLRVSDAEYPAPNPPQAQPATSA